MARNRKPTALLELHGAFDKHPERKRERAFEPKPTGPLGQAPRHLTDDQKKLWKELSGMVAPGVLTVSDRWHLEIAVRLMEKLRKADIKSSELAILNSVLAKMGMNPTDRSKVAAIPQPEKQEDSWASFVEDDTEDHVTQ